MKRTIFECEGTRWGRRPDGTRVEVEGDMLALSLLQPWAQLCVIGGKLYETRGRNTSKRGRTAIHASTRKDGLTVLGRWPFAKLLGGEPLPTGAIVGVVTVVDAIKIPAVAFSRWRRGVPRIEVAVGDWREGRWAYELTDPVLLEEPIPTRGYPWWWEVRL